MKHIYLTDEQHQMVLDCLRERSYQLNVFGPFTQARKNAAKYIDDLRELIKNASDLPLTAHLTAAQRSQEGMTFEECMNPPECPRFPKCGCPSRYECINFVCKKD